MFQPTKFSLALICAVLAVGACDTSNDGELASRRALVEEGVELEGSCEVAYPDRIDPCEGRAHVGNCWCDDACEEIGDCCADTASVCGEGIVQPGCGGPDGITCAADEVCLYPEDDVCGEAGSFGACSPTADGCSEEWAPVCGCDGQTYSNGCHAHAAGVAIAYDGECPVLCPGGSDYDYIGTSDEACAVIDFDCPDGTSSFQIDGCGCGCRQDPQPTAQMCGGMEGAACGEAEFCDFKNDAADACGAADHLGVCTARPEACIEIYDPVCGCDGMSYPNECYAHAAGTDILASGPC